MYEQHDRPIFWARFARPVKNGPMMRLIPQLHWVRSLQWHGRHGELRLVLVSRGYAGLVAVSQAWSVMFRHSEPGIRWAGSAMAWQVWNGWCGQSRTRGLRLGIAGTEPLVKERPGLMRHSRRGQSLTVTARSVGEPQAWCRGFCRGGPLRDSVRHGFAGGESLAKTWLVRAR